MNALFDTHAHYDHPLFAGKGPQLLRELLERRAAGGAVIPAISFDSNGNRELFPPEDFPTVFFAPGLHPNFAMNEPLWDLDKREKFSHILEEPRSVAVKTGLDFSRTKLTEGQKEHELHFFRFMIDLAEEHGLPLVLHVRDAFPEAAAVLREKPLSTEAAVHCFTGGGKEARELMEAGVTRFGVGGMLTRDGMDDLRDCVQELPLSALLLETDAPFVKPKGYDGKVNTSETLPVVAELIAALKDLPTETVTAALQKNAVDFFRLSGRLTAAGEGRF